MLQCMLISITCLRVCRNRSVARLQRMASIREAAERAAQAAEMSSQKQVPKKAEEVLVVVQPGEILLLSC
jgi:hypothetical protein